MKQRKFIVGGYKPLISKLHNDLLKYFDLGIEGSFVPFADDVTLTLEENITQEKLERQPGALKAAYQNEGCVNVVVTEKFTTNYSLEDYQKLLEK